MFVVEHIEPVWALVRCLVCRFKVESVDVVIEREKRFLVQLKDGEGGVRFVPTIYATGHEIEEHRGARVRETVDKFKLGEMCVRVRAESNYVLVALHENSESHSKLVLALVGRVVREQDCYTTFGLNLLKLLF